MPSKIVSPKPKATPAKRSALASRSSAVRAKPVLDLERYVPAFLTWISNKLSRGASQHYLSAFGVGIETWRCMVLPAVEGSASVQRTAKVVGMDKASVSRTFKRMHRDGLITIELDPIDGRARIAKLTPKGRELHDNIISVALERERALLSVLDDDEKEVLIKLLTKLDNNLPHVETATADYVRRKFPQTSSQQGKQKQQDEAS